jgi:hypothetical protein
VPQDAALPPAKTFRFPTACLSTVSCVELPLFLPMTFYLRFPFFLFPLPFLKFPVYLSILRSEDIAEYPNTFFHVNPGNEKLLRYLVNELCNLTGMSEASLLFFTLSSLRRSQVLLVLRFFCFSAPYQFTPLSNLRPLIFGLKLFGWFVSIYLFFFLWEWF